MARREGVAECHMLLDEVKVPRYGPFAALSLLDRLTILIQRQKMEAAPARDEPVPSQPLLFRDEESDADAAS